MNIDFRRARLALAAGRLDQCPNTGIPEVVFSGRSNVGKSSLINAITDQKKLARISQAPGKTRIILYFIVDERFYLTDLPGYGYAKVAQSIKENFDRLVDGYLNTDRPIRLVLHLLDIRHDPGDSDRQMIAWMQTQGIPFQIVLTKSDKMSRQAANLRIQEMARLLDTDVSGLVPFSSTTRQGVDAIRNCIAAVMG